MIHITKQQARRFLLLKQGLLGEYKFIGKQGVLDYIRQSGCIQYDPIDICGKNAELALQSRVKNFTKNMLAELLYEERVLLDYPDKNTAIILADDWPCFFRSRNWARNCAAEYPQLMELMTKTLAIIKEKGVVCPDDIQLNSNLQWRSHIVWSSGNNISSSVLEQLYGAGYIIIHHKKGTRKYYDLTERYLSKELLDTPDPFVDETSYLKWKFMRFIGAIGLLWNRPTDVLPYMKTETRNKIFGALLEESLITAVDVEGIKHTFYMHSADMPLMELALKSEELEWRCELIAPLDCLMWDRRIINAIFDFEYKWEIYTPVPKRKYGHYVFPILFGERFIGRIEAIVEKKTRTLVVKNIWFENDIKLTDEIKTTITNSLKRFAEFNNCGALRIN